MILDLPVQQPLILNIIKLEQNPWTEKTNTTKNEYVTVANDTLTKIAEAHQTTVQRLWEANTDLTNPDLIKPNQKLLIPLPNENLPDRPLPVQTSPEPIKNAPQTTYRGSSGNTYTPRYCTWLVKQELGWVRNGWGNAVSWASNARSQGFVVNNVPAVGSVAQTTAGYAGHVAIVIGVGDGTVTVREMNYVGLGITSTRTTATSSFVYIHP